MGLKNKRIKKTKKNKKKKPASITSLVKEKRNWNCQYETF